MREFGAGDGVQATVVLSAGSPRLWALGVRLWALSGLPSALGVRLSAFGDQEVSGDALRCYDLASKGLAEHPKARSFPRLTEARVTSLDTT